MSSSPRRNRNPLSMRLLLLLGLWLAAWAAPTGAQQDTPDLLSSAPEWKRSAWQEHGTVERDRARHHGSGASIRITARKANDIRVVKPVRVRAGRFYRFSAWVKTEGVEGAVGANLAIEGSFNRSRLDLTGTHGWTPVERVFRATRDESLSFALRLGHWHATATGIAWFDRARLEELEHWGGAYEAIDLAEPDPGVVSRPLRLALFVFLVPFLYGGLVWLRRTACVEAPPRRTASRRAVIGIALLLLAGFLARLALALAPVPQGPPSAAALWALYLAEPSNLWNGPPLPDLAAPGPLWAWWLSLAGALAKAQLWENAPGFELLLRLPALVAEMFGVALALWFLRARVPPRLFRGAAVFLVFSPALLFGTALYGLPQALAAAGLLASVVMVLRGRRLAAGASLGLALAATPAVAWLAPVIGAWIAARQGWRRAGWTLLVAALAGAAVFAPVAGLYPPWPSLWQTLAAPGASSFWSGVDLPPSLSLLVPSAVALLLAWRTLSLARNTGGDDLLPRMVALAALSLMAVWSGAEPGLLYPAVLFSALAWGAGSAWRWLHFLLALTATGYWAYGYAQTYLELSPAAGPGALAQGVQVLLALLCVAAWRLAAPGAAREETGRSAGLGGGNAAGPTSVPSALPASTFRPRGWDAAALVAVTAAGLFLIAHDMGERLHPLNPYQLAAESEVFEVVFAPPVQLRKVRLYTGANGVGAARFEAETGEGWKPLWSKDKGHLRYKGTQLPRRSTFKVVGRGVKLPDAVGRVRMTLSGQGFDVNEIVFFDKRLQVVTPAALVASGNESIPARAHPLFDEPDRITQEASYRAETYWDEVYYARSAYELVQGITPFEDTHPPLGKSLIAIGVELLDMTPFGWRFMNALVIALFPVLLWLAARWMFGTRFAAYSAAFLGFFELIFFVHGRWANIDAFLAFFLTASLVALFRWYQLDEGRFSRRGTPWFLAAGIAFGLALAVKWSALFTGFAVFVLWAVLQASRAASALSERASRGRFFAVRLPLDIAAWGAAFVVVPGIIYYLSYAPVLAALPDGPSLFSAGGWQAFVDQQAHQWGYHAGKESGHKSSSLFVAWPVMWQPVSLVKIGGLPEGMRATVQILGNPVIWWAGLAAMLALGWRAALGRDRIALSLAGIYFLQCLPWLLVTRTTYLYHYLPYLPLVILGIVYWLQRLDLRRRSARAAVGLLALAVIAGFALFYPYVTAIPVPVAWTDSLRVFDSWSRL